MAAVTWKEAQTQYDHKHLAPGQKYKGMSATMYSDADGIQTGCHLLMIHRGGATLMLAPEQCPSSSLTAALSANLTTLTCRWAQHSMTPVRIVCSAAWQQASPISTLTKGRKIMTILQHVQIRPSGSRRCRNKCHANFILSADMREQ